MKLKKTIFSVAAMACVSSISIAQSMDTSQLEHGYNCQFVAKGNEAVVFQVDVAQDQVFKTVDSSPYAVQVHWLKNSGLLSLDITAPNGQKALFYSRGVPPYALTRLAGDNVYATVVCELH